MNKLGWFNGYVWMQTINSFKSAFVNAAKSLKGYAKRLFMAQTVEDVFGGKAYRAEIALGWNRQTITKGLRELRSNLECIDGRRGLTGRKSIEVKLPNLLLDIQDLIDSQSQTEARRAISSDLHLQGDQRYLHGYSRAMVA